MSEDEICEVISSQAVTPVRRINIRRNNDLIQMNTLILTFDRPALQSVMARYCNITVDPYIPNPLWCF